MSSQRYQEFIAERTRLLERIKELENENAELRKRLGELVEPVTSASNAMQNLSLQEKIDLFCSLFKGRDDVFARRWYSKTSGKAGYQPVCQNEWTPLCDKRKYKCADCPNRQFSPLTYNDYYRHLEGKDSDGRDVIGLYVLNEDNTCHLLCTDFDDKNCEHGYQDDVLAFVDVCRSWNVPYSIERSRSGNGAHVWIFFDSPVLAVKARKLGNAILTEAMNRNGKIGFKSYDRFFPNQDTLPEGGLGNLVALPLQGNARKNGNSVFVNEFFEPYPDQWQYLLNVDKFSEQTLEELLKQNANTIPLGDLSKTSESKPWEVPVANKIERTDFASEIVIISRSGKDNYENISRHADARVIVNATPVGMFPHNGISPVDLDGFPHLEGVLDLIYNPARTALLLAAEARGIPCLNGLYMLAAQAKQASELFRDTVIDEKEIARITAVISEQTANIVLIGMPGCGKTTVGKLLSEHGGRPFLDTDSMIEERAGCTCGDYLRANGEEAFRKLETEVLKDACKRTGCVISTGGGVVTRKENLGILRQNGVIFHLDRPLEVLSRSGDRPLSDTPEKLMELYKARAPMYAGMRDAVVLNEDAEKTAREIECLLRAHWEENR